MSLQPGLVLLVAAVVFFWATGVHHRLMALRRQVQQAAARLSDLLTQRSGALRDLLSALQQPLVAEQRALGALGDAHQQSLAALQVLSAKPLDPAAARGWVAAEAHLASGAARVLALLDQQPAARQHAQVDAPLTLWMQAQARVPLMRHGFNDAAAAHDHALAQFPTRLLARVFRFVPVGRL